MVVMRVDSSDDDDDDDDDDCDDDDDDDDGGDDDDDDDDNVDDDDDDDDAMDVLTSFSTSWVYVLVQSRDILGWSPKMSFKQGLIKVMNGWIYR